MKKKIVLHLTPAYSPQMGGVEHHVEQVCQELSQRGYICQILTLRLKPEWPLQEKKQKSSIYRLNAGADPGPKATRWSRTWYKLTVWWHLAGYLKIIRHADIIQIHDVWWWIWPFRLVLPKSKLFMTFHGYEGSQNPDEKQMRAHQRAANITKANLCIGGFHEKWYGVKPSLISFGAVKVVGKEKKVIIDQTKDVLKLIYAGRLDSDVGIMEYLQGLRKYIEKFPSLKVQVDAFGSGPLLTQAKNFSKRHNLPVTFHGWVEPKSIVWSNYNAALVSRHLAIIEALAQGLPVIAHYNSPIKMDYLLMCPFAKWIKVFEESGHLEKIIDNISPLPPSAQAWAKKQTWQKMVDVYEELWKNE